MVPETKIQRSHHWLARMGQSLIAASEGGGCWNLLISWLRILTFWVVIFYLVVLVALSLALSWIGERNPTTAFLIFLPPAIWLLPMAPLAMMSLLLNRRALLLLLAAGVWFGYCILDWRQGGRTEVKPDDSSRSLIVMTNNHGQHMNQSLQPFKNAVQPDIIVLQESPGRAAYYQQSENYVEFPFAQSLSEHTILSRHPILESKQLPALPGLASKAVRFVIDWKGKHVAIYSVHLRSPRDTLTYQRWGPFLYGIIGVPGTPWAEKRRRVQGFWNHQIEDAQIVLKAVSEDPLPAVVAGDFNAPHTGYIHRLVTRQLKDSHAEAGKGFGLTFPGFTNNPLSLGGPWMRIDYVFYDHHWDAVQCVTEPDRPSQHRALAAKLLLKQP